MRKRGIDLRGFTLSYDGDARSGYVLWRLMGGSLKDEPNVDLAKYYATRGKLTHLDEVYGLDGYTALTRACENGYLEIVKCLLAAGVDKDKADNGGNAPLIWAAIRGHVEAVQLLLAAGANKNKVTSGGETALSLATSEGHQEIIQLLQSAGPQP